MPLKRKRLREYLSFIMAQQKALYLQAKHGNFEIVEIPTPKPGTEEILVKVKPKDRALCGL